MRYRTAALNPDTEEFDPASRVPADHRLTDGAEVARYLDELKMLLENPMRLLVG